MMTSENMCFRERAAVASWIIITLIEKNDSFFDDHNAEFVVAMEYLNRGLSLSENGDDRAAFGQFKRYLGRAINQYRSLLTEDAELFAGLSRLAAMDADFHSYFSTPVET